jgi:hypothetical protein
VQVDDEGTEAITSVPFVWKPSDEL